VSFKVFTNKDSSIFKKKVEEIYNEIDASDLYPPFPKTSLIELSNACNHACVFCTNPRMKRKKGFLNIEIYEKFVRDAIALGLRNVGLYSTGEPFLMKNLNDYIRIAKDAGAGYIYITTNGALATPEKLISAIDAGLNSIKFSVNAGTRETYKLTHGADNFDKVMENIRFVSNYRKEKNIDLTLMASCVLTKYTDDEEEIVKDQLLPLVDDLAFYGVFAQFGQSIDQLDMLRSTMTDSYPELGKASACSMVWNRVHLSCEGYLSMCCGDYENALVYADAKVSSLEDAWHNHVITEMRKRHQAQELDGTLCKNCLYGTKDRVLPITDIAHKDVQTELKSDKAIGVQSVNERISKLALLKRTKE